MLNSLLLALVASPLAAVAAPAFVYPRQTNGSTSTTTKGQTFFVVGQNYRTEWEAFSSGFGKTPSGISIYTNIYDGIFDSDGIKEMQWYGPNYSGFVELGISWKDGQTDHGYTQYEGARLQYDIAAGKWDKGLDSIVQQISGFPKVTFLVRPDYEVSGNQHANTNPNKNDDTTWDFKAYPAAFRHVKQYLDARLPNAQYMFHPVRSMAEKMYPGDDVVDYQAVSVFNNDVCLENAGTFNCDGKRLDDNIIRDIKFARKPLWIAESACQPPFCARAGDFINYLERVRDMIETYDFAGWTYINSDWNKHGWSSNIWGDSRLEAMPEVKAWFQTNILGKSRYQFA